jgi:NAD(P)H-dependent FMN reductase
VPKPLLQIIICSTRPGRVGPAVGDWITATAEADGRFEVEVVDLAEVNLPMFDEPKHPRFRQYEHQHTRDWSAVIDRADAFIFVVPEYNYGYNAATKNAIDYLNHEWKYKPVGYASYGGVAAGTRAVQQLKQVMTTLKMVPLFEAVNIPFVQQFLDAGKRLQPNEVMTEAAAAMLDELARLAATLRPLRIPERPEPAEPETEDIDPQDEPVR